PLRRIPLPPRELRDAVRDRHPLEAPIVVRRQQRGFRQRLPEAPAVVQRDDMRRRDIAYRCALRRLQRAGQERGGAGRAAADELSACHLEWCVRMCAHVRLRESILNLVAGSQRNAMRLRRPLVMSCGAVALVAASSLLAQTELPRGPQTALARTPPM